ncbi:hypothetical protein V6N12_045808 [Hibiscus sabdariffa]|uniref:Uncharacterized protein n=1 Tax=Hibiscus sabdariffa TaxID=183260 RepID=A0ABR2G401_9ROSI
MSQSPTTTQDSKHPTDTKESCCCRAIWMVKLAQERDVEGNTNGDGGVSSRPSFWYLMKVVGKKLAMNPNSYACVIGLVLAFVTNRQHCHKQLSPSSLPRNMECMLKFLVLRKNSPTLFKQG